MKTGKAARTVKRILLIVLAAALLFSLGVIINHRVRSSRELALLKERGYYNPVSVGDHSLNVSVFGNENGKHTIVGLAGLGSGDFSSSMRQMTKTLEEDNKVVFVDRAGYGLSGDTNNEMTLEYIVEDYRKALKNAGIEAPYVLMPHSIGGAYATYWESNFPDEIEAVVFIDGSELSADAFDDEPKGQVNFGDRFLAALAKLGFSRLVLRDYFYHYPDNYSDEEQYLGDAMVLLTADSMAPVSESYHLAGNAQAAFNSIAANDIPKLYICASWGISTKEELAEYSKWINRQIEINHLDLKQKPVDPDDEYVEKYLFRCEELRNDILVPYLEKMGNCELVLLAGDHMIYEQKPEECGEIVKGFIDRLK